MKSSKPSHPECKSPDLTNADMVRTKLPRLQKALKKTKRPQTKSTSRGESQLNKNEKFSEDMHELQTIISKRYKPKPDPIKKTKTSLSYNPTDNKNPSQKPDPSTSSSDSEDLLQPATKSLFKFSKRVYFNRRLEMGNRNLLVINFEGVLGEFFKENFWDDKDESFHIRKGIIPGLRSLSKQFQIALFFICSKSDSGRVVSYLLSKHVRIDAAYTSENLNRWKLASDKVKRPLKYSEHIQNYSQLTIDFGIQHEVISRMLVLTSYFLEPGGCAVGSELVVQNLHSIPVYLCRAVPVLDDQDSLLPITFAVPDPRLDGIGTNFTEISSLIESLCHFSADFEESSWMEGFAKIRQSPQKDCVAFETSAYQFGLAQNPGREAVLSDDGRCLCPYDMRSTCKLRDFGRCTVYKKMKNVADEVKYWDKNKFIVFKGITGSPYKVIHFENIKNN